MAARRDLLNTQILATLQAWHEATGFYPSVRELATRLNASTSVISAHLRQLRARGYVAFEDGKWGTLRLCVPLVTFTAAECEAAMDAKGYAPAWVEGVAKYLNAQGG